MLMDGQLEVLPEDELEAIESFVEWHMRDGRKRTTPETILVFEDGDEQDSVYGQVKALFYEGDDFAADQIEARNTDRSRLRRVLVSYRRYKQRQIELNDSWFNHLGQLGDWSSAWKAAAKIWRAAAKESRRVLVEIAAERDELRGQLAEARQRTLTFQGKYEGQLDENRALEKQVTWQGQRIAELEKLVPDEELLRQLGVSAAKMSGVYDGDGRFHLAKYALGNSIKAKMLATAIRTYREATDAKDM